MTYKYFSLFFFVSEQSKQSLLGNCNSCKSHTSHSSEKKKLKQVQEVSYEIIPCHCIISLTTVWSDYWFTLRQIWLQGKLIQLQSSLQYKWMIKFDCQIFILSHHATHRLNCSPVDSSAVNHYTWNFTNIWVIEWLNLTAFLGTVNSEVHRVHLSHVITVYTLESVSSLT